MQCTGQNNGRTASSRFLLASFQMYMQKYKWIELISLTDTEI